MSNNVFNQRDFKMKQANKITGAEIVIKALIDQGVDTVFGYPGGAILPIYDELFQQKKIKEGWERSLSILRAEIGEATFKSWFKNIQFGEFVENKLVNYKIIF